MTKEIILYTGISYLGNMRVVEISPLDNEAVKVKVAGKDKLTYYFKKVTNLSMLHWLVILPKLLIRIFISFKHEMNL